MHAVSRDWRVISDCANALANAGGIGVAYDRGLVERIADVVDRIGLSGVRQKGVFGGRGFLIGKRAFAIVWGDGLIVKTTPADYETVLAEAGVTLFRIDGEQPSRNWVVVAAEAIADDPELTEWIRRAAAVVR